MKLLIASLALLFVACSSPSDPDPVTPADIHVAPDGWGDRLYGVWKDPYGATLSQNGLIETSVNVHYATDLRVKGKSVWFKALGYNSLRYFSGLIDGNHITGMHELSLVQPDGSIFQQGTPRAYTFTRIQ